MYLIQGFFFQERPSLGLSALGGDLHAVFLHGLVRSLFSGVIGPDNCGEGILVGRLVDPLGESIVDDVHLTETALTFNKKYDGRPDVVRYAFTKQADGTWVGTYDGEETGNGFARCILVPVSEEFLRMPSRAVGTGCASCGNLFDDDPGDVRFVKSGRGAIVEVTQQAGLSR